MYLESFTLPIEKENRMIKERMTYNGGPYGYIDNIYPCGLFSEKKLYEMNFDRITIFYGGNGSGKSTLLNLIANKLELNRVAPFNSSELFSQYTYECEYCMSAGRLYDKLGKKAKGKIVYVISGGAICKITKNGLDDKIKITEAQEMVEEKLSKEEE